MKDQKIVERLAMLERIEASKGILALAKRSGIETCFADTMLVLWGELEYTIDILVAGEYGMEYADSKATFLTNHTFEDKIEFLRQSGILYPDALMLIRRFQKKRNELFHSKRGKERLYFTLTKDEKLERMSDAWAAYIGTLGAIDLREAQQLDEEPPEERQLADERERRRCPR